MPNFNSIGSGVSALQVAENRYLPLTGGIALTLCKSGNKVLKLREAITRYYKT